MQVKKFEAPTIQEALETIKRELGPEAIILQTKQNKRGFGLMSKGSVEVTVAISDRSLQKKSFAEKRLNSETRKVIEQLPADRQAEFYDKVLDKHLERAARTTTDRVDLGRSRGSKNHAPQAPAVRPAQPATTRAVPARPASASAYARAQAYQEPPQAEPSGMAASRGHRASAPQASNRPAQGRPGAGGLQTTSVPSVTPVRYIDIEDEEQQVSARPAGKALGASGMTVEEELKHLKRMIEEMRIAQDQAGPSSGAQALMKDGGAFSSPALQDAFETLVLNGLDKRFARPLLKKVAFELGEEKSQDPEQVLDQLAVEIMEESEVVSLLAGVKPGEIKGGPLVIALVGPTGVGKTTTVAKIASDALLKRNLKVGLINLDTYKVAAFDQLATYAKILNVPFRCAASREDLKAAIADFHALDVVLVDTTGRSQKDPDALREMDSMLQSIGNVQTQLVLSVTTRDAELYDMANRFSVFRPRGLIISKLDEASIFGALYNVSQRVKLPLVYFTTGQRVPEDIEEASKERVAALIMDL